MDYLGSSDSELLEGWAHRRCGDSFRALIERYSGLVYLASWRTADDDALATDASCKVFASLAKNAGRLCRRPSLAGWLHGTAVATTRQLLDPKRPNTAHATSIQAAMECRQVAETDAWGALRPAIDGALATLAERDRDLLLQRHYRMRTLNAVAATLNITAPEARKRIDKATAALRHKLEKHGHTTDGGLTGMLTAGFEADARAGASLAGALVGPAMTSVTSGGNSVSPPPSLRIGAVAGLAVVVLAGAILWTTQARTISRIEADVLEMRETLAHHETPPPEPGSTAPTPTALDESPVDWRLLAHQLRLSQPAAPVNPMAYLEARIAAMSARDILAALEDIEQADLTDEDRERLQQRLCRALTTTTDGHRIALDHFLPSINEHSWSWTLGSHFSDWLGHDAEAALGWLGKNVDHIRSLSNAFIPQAFYPRLASEPDVCAMLLAAIPESRRLEALQSLDIGQLDADALTAWAHVIRAAMHGDDRLTALAWPVRHWSDGDGAPMSMGEVNDYLSRIQPSPEELEACLIAAAADGASATVDRAFAFSTTETPTLRQDGYLPTWIDGLRVWIDDHEPTLTDRATGVALAHHGHDFAEAADIALQLHAQDADDNLLIPLLEKGPSHDEDRPLARQLAAQLADPALRAAFTEAYSPENP